MKLVFVFTFFTALNFYAQDILYSTSGNKIMGKVLEINTTDIKYKESSNLEGPTYVISKNDIVLIEYSNGSAEIINENPPTLVPQKTTTNFENLKPIEKKKPLNLYYLNANLLSINALSLANGDVTLIYDRDFAANKLSLTVLGGYNFNARMGGLNAMIVDSRDKAKKNFDVGLGINFMPSNTKRVQYFVGLLAKYMSYNYQKLIDTSNNQYKYTEAQGNQFALMISNGWVYRISPSFNFKIFGSFGVPVNTPKLDNYMGVPKIYLGYCFGYRF